jgi:hypothetical protein
LLASGNSNGPSLNANRIIVFSTSNISDYIKKAYYYKNLCFLFFMLLQNQGAGYGDGKVNLWKMKLYSIIHLSTSGLELGI